MEYQLTRYSIILICLKCKSCTEFISTVIVLCICKINFQILQVLQVCCSHVPAQIGQEYILIVGTARQILAELNMAVFRALGAEVF
jgi:hypothetical protein